MKHFLSFAGGFGKSFALVAIVSGLWANPAALLPLPPNVEPVDSTGDLVAAIRKGQGVAGNSDLNADKVGDVVLIELGRLVMDDMLGANPVHLWLDTMVGGESSQTLRTVRRQVGYNYLRGRTGRFPGFTHSPFEWRARVDSEQKTIALREAARLPARRPRRAGLTKTTLIVGATIVAEFIIIVLVLLQLLEYRRQASDRDALDMLEKRYARGGISATEFEERKAVLTRPPTGGSG